MSNKIAPPLFPLSLRETARHLTFGHHGFVGSTPCGHQHVYTYEEAHALVLMERDVVRYLAAGQLVAKGKFVIGEAGQIGDLRPMVQADWKVSADVDVDWHESSVKTSQGQFVEVEIDGEQVVKLGLKLASVLPVAPEAVRTSHEPTIPASEALADLPPVEIGAHLDKMQKRKGAVPALKEAYLDTRQAHPDRRVTRNMVGLVHCQKFGKQSPGKRRSDN